MRDKLNSSPIAQVAVVLVLGVAAFAMLTSAGGGSGGQEAAPAEATVSSAPTEGLGGAVPGESAPVALPTPPLPAPVAAAYLANKTVVLLIVHNGGIDDRLVATSTRRLEAFPEVTVFIVSARQIAHYGAITLGVDVQQVPALVVMRPRRLSGGKPQALVSYGFQTQAGIEQAMRDASYNGPDETYHPN